VAVSEDFQFQPYSNTMLMWARRYQVKPTDKYQVIVPWLCLDWELRAIFVKNSL